MNSLRTGNQNLVKQINKSIVFKCIENKGPVSRAQISKETGLNKATVSSMVTELINESFVYEIGSGQSSGGRKPVMLYFNNLAGYSIGIDLGVNYILGVLTDLRGTIIEETTISMNETAFEYVLENIIFVIEDLIDKAPNSTYGIVGIGVGVPGNVDKDDKILFAPNLHWKQVDLKLMIENRFRIPVTIENEANAGSHGERLYGAGKNISNLIYISIGIGIGTGIIIDNQLYTGASGISGEMGHVTIDANGRKCSCGNRGCWELYASESALLKEAKTENLLSKEDGSNLGYLIDEAQSGNPVVLRVLNQLGEYIGIGLTNIINTFNPEVVIIGNRMAQFEQWIANPIDNMLSERLSTFHKEGTEVRFSNLGKHSCAIGAASFSVSKFMDDKRVTVR
ncbi:ROK family transcriptional regulator [Lentibacillus sp. L22]|uniref:ROK family transcriptional regulator n=1 Tax=Lentibacillus TaxID=175304 RepID=UPI0022B1B274|nr:ROK family transcriptional regulator [Lentibacillus daqui]